MIAGGYGVEVDLEELRRRVKEARCIAGVEAWLRGLCGGVTGTSAVASAAAGGRLGTALVGQSYVLGELAQAIGLQRCLTEAFGEETGLALLYLAMHQAVQGEPLYLAEHWLDDLWLPEAIAEFDFPSPGHLPGDGRRGALTPVAASWPGVADPVPLGLPVGVGSRAGRAEYRWVAPSGSPLPAGLGRADGLVSSGTTAAPPSLPFQGGFVLNEASILLAVPSS